MEYIVMVWPVLAVVAAAIAKAKGRSFFLWLLYGLVLMPVALIHALVMPAAEPAYIPVATPSLGGAGTIGTASASVPDMTAATPLSVADELIKLADLQERGFITKDEYDVQKAKLLGVERSGPSAA